MSVCICIYKYSLNVDVCVHMYLLKITCPQASEDIFISLLLLFIGFCLSSV